MSYRSDAEAVLARRANVVEQRRTLTDSITGDPNGEQRTQLDRMDADITSLAAEARAIIEMGEREAEARDLSARAALLVNGENAGRGSAPGAPSLSDEIRALDFGQSINVLPAEGRMGLAEARVALTSSATNAGDTIATNFVAKVLTYSLANIGVWQAGPTMVTTANGEPMVFPRLTSDPTVGPVAENTQYPSTDAGFDKFTLGAHKYGAIVQVSAEMAQDSMIDLAGFVAQRAGMILGRQIAGDMLNGNGTTQPTGLLTVATSGTTAGTAGAIEGDDLINLHYSVIDAYRKNAVFLMNDATVGSIRRLKDAYGQYLWQPGLTAGAPDMIMGKPVITDVNMPTNTAAGKKAILFGDVSTFYVRQVNGISVEKSFEYGWGSDLISYKVNWRGDANLSDLTGSVKYLTTA